MRALNYKTTLTAALFFLVLTACRKNHDVPPPKEHIPSVNDSMFFLFKDQYLWNDVIPDSAGFKPNSYSKIENMFAALIAYKKQNGKNLDKYSFLDDGTVAGEIGEGAGAGFGMDVNYNEVNDLRVVYVYEGSAAYNAGIRRTWRITAINGNTNISYDGSGPNVQRVIRGIYQSSTVTLTLQKPDGSTATATLNSADFQINPLLYSTILNVSGKKVGYFVFNQFLDIANKNNAALKNKISAMFDNFISNDIAYLIVDLRYNGGGAVNATEYLANLIAPVSVGTDTRVMYTDALNATLSRHEYSNYLKEKQVPGLPYKWGEVFDSWADNPAVPFKKEKTLNISNVAFIGTGSTASASELLINVLRPYMNVKLIGDTTYGKPVGFVGMRIGNYDMYAVSLWSKNSAGNGDYFDGMIPDDAASVSDAEKYEDYSKDWGSLDEVYLRRALKVLGLTPPVTLMSRSRSASSDSKRTLMVRSPLPDTRFKGMIREFPAR